VDHDRVGTMWANLGQCTLSLSSLRSHPA
jgi:hypothetical protein